MKTIFSDSQKSVFQWNTTKGNTFKKNVFIRITAKRAIKLVILQALFLFPKTKIIVNCISEHNKSTPNFTFYFALFLNCPFWLIWCSHFLVGGNKCIKGGIILPKSISNLHLFTIIFELFGLNSTLHCSIVDNWQLSLGHMYSMWRSLECFTIMRPWRSWQKGVWLDHPWMNWLALRLGVIGNPL